MRLEEYLGSLPAGIMSGEEVALPDSALRGALGALGVGKGDVFYHLGCRDARGCAMAAGEFGASKAVGIDLDASRVEAARAGSPPGVEMRRGDAREADISDATAVLFWFADGDVVSGMLPRFGRLGDGCRIATLWGPLPGCLPDLVRFPYVVSRTPLRPAADLREQLLAVFGVGCVDFVTAWEHAERYTKAVQPPDAQNNRFVTIIQALSIWISAKNLGVACGEGVPEPVSAYMGILRNFYGIETAHLLDGGE